MHHRPSGLREIFFLALIKAIIYLPNTERGATLETGSAGGGA